MVTDNITLVGYQIYTHSFTALGKLYNTCPVSTNTVNVIIWNMFYWCVCV